MNKLKNMFKNKNKALISTKTKLQDIQPPPIKRTTITNKTQPNIKPNKYKRPVPKKKVIRPNKKDQKSLSNKDYNKKFPVKPVREKLVTKLSDDDLEIIDIPLQKKEIKKEIEYEFKLVRVGKKMMTLRMPKKNNI